MKRRIKRRKAQFIVAFAIVLLLAFSLESAFASPTADEKEEKPVPPDLTESYFDKIRKKLNSITGLLKRLVEEKEKQNIDRSKSSPPTEGCYAETFEYGVTDEEGNYTNEEDFIGESDGYGTFLRANETIYDLAYVVGEMGWWAERNDDIYLRCRTAEINLQYENYITVWTNEDLNPYEDDWYCAGWVAPDNQTSSWQTLELDPDPFTNSSDGAFKYVAICVYKEFEGQQTYVEVDSVYADVLYYELTVSSHGGGYTNCYGIQLVRENTTSPQYTGTPYEGYYFDKWESDLGDFTDNPVNIPMGYTNHYLKAIFCANGTAYDVTVCAYLDEPYQGPITGVDIAVYVDGNYFTIIDETFSVPAGTHTIGVDDWFEVDYEIYLVFDYFDVGTGDNPTTVNITSDMTATAHYYLSA